MSANIKPFKIDVPEASISKLKEKLAASAFFEETDFTDNWDYGAPLSDVKRLAQHWQNGFDWRAAEAKLNEQLPQFTTTISVDNFEELEVHFVHQKSEDPNSIPLLFCHGWPGSFLEVIKILPLLTKKTGDSPSFHVVAPSLPNFGFSQGVTKKGFSIPQYAEVCHKLMQQLGYTRYTTQGGDWGYIITRMMGALYPSQCLASHVNFFIAPPPSPLKAPLLFLQLLLLPWNKFERAGVARTKWFRDEGYGYNQLQSTRPLTIGFALQDSPVALLAWVYEKLHDWTDSYPWTDDEVLTWISIYQFSRAGPAASVRIYYETKHGMAQAQKAIEYNSRVPMGFSYFPRDIHNLPRVFAKQLGPVAFQRFHESGGHFAAYEAPDLLVGDLRTMFGKGGGAQAVAQKLGSKL